MPVEFINDKWVPVCGNCKTVSPHKWVSGKDWEACSNCTNVPDSRPRDAMGNVVKVSDDVIGKFSYAIGEPITSQRQYARVLREKGLAQKG